jgi:hypothetical protein
MSWTMLSSVFGWMTAWETRWLISPASRAGFRVVWSRVCAKQETCFAKSPAFFDRASAIATTLWALGGRSDINVHYVSTSGLLPYHAH